MTISNSNTNKEPENVEQYVVLDNLKFNIFSKDWSAKEELLLLQGITKCGMGNWIDISEQYVKTKGPDDCEEHYFTFYYKSKEDNLPTENDCIIKGSRQIIRSGGETTIEIPIDKEKTVKAEKRKLAFHEQRQKELKEEDEELAQRNRASQQN